LSLLNILALMAMLMLGRHLRATKQHYD
jgi:hypothetical protein